MIPKTNVKYYITKDKDTLMNVSANLGANIANVLSQNNPIYLEKDQLLVFRSN